METANDPRVQPATPLPQPVPENYVTWPADLVVTRDKRTSKNRWHTESRKHTVCRPSPPETLCLTVTGDHERCAFVHTETCEHRVQFQPIQIHRITNGKFGFSAIFVIWNNDTMGLRIRKRLEHHTVYDAEDDRIRPDAEREHQNYKKEEGGPAIERPQRVVEILH